MRHAACSARQPRRRYADDPRHITHQSGPLGHHGAGLFEAYLKNILDTLDGNPKLKAHTAVFVIFDETGGYYDSGFIQPLDFFGDGPRIPLIVVSPFSRGGKVSYTYSDHVSILKFIERNWDLLAAHRPQPRQSSEPDRAPG